MTFVRLPVSTVGVALLFCLNGCRSMLPYEGRYVSSDAMGPTLQKHDRILIDQDSYTHAQPSRGDIIIFHATVTLQQQGFRSAFVERVIGLPGETITFRGGQVYVNQAPLVEPYLTAGVPTGLEACEYGDAPPSPFAGGAVTIPPNAFVVLGDNRLNSYDSRCWGFITRGDIIGQVVYRYWPLDRMGTLD